MHERFKASNIDGLKMLAAITASVGALAAGCAIESDATQDVSPEPSERNYMSEPMEPGWLRGASDDTAESEARGPQDHLPVEERSFMSSPLGDNWLIGSFSE